MSRENAAEQVLPIRIAPREETSLTCCRCRKRLEQDSRTLMFNGLKEADTVFQWFHERARVQFGPSGWSVHVPLCYTCLQPFKEVVLAEVEHGITQRRVEVFLSA